MTGVASRARLLEELAGVLLEAESARRPVEPLTDRCTDLTLAEAYAIQRRNIDRRLAVGARIIGHKIGLTAIEMQQRFGVNEPDFGHLLDDMLIPPGCPLEMDELIDPQIEVEPAFVLCRDLSGPGITIEDVLAATKHVCTCFEVIDSRVAGWRIRLQDTVADNGSSARLLMGRELIDPRALALDSLETVLEIDGSIVGMGNTRAILGHPASGVAWLANAIAAFGLGLEAGQIVLPGTCTRSYRIGGHRHARGSIAGLGEVLVELRGRPFIANTDE